MPILMQTVLAALRAQRLVCDTERRLHASIETALQSADIAFDREVRLSPVDRIDFMVRSIGIEAKVRGARLSVWRQLERYARRAEISAVVLVGSIAMPNVVEIEGKPFAHVSIGSAWL